jgi:predicted NUDIX family phosphoesterase
MASEILVVKKDILFKDGDFDGFLETKKRDFSKIIAKNFEFRERNDALESNPDYIQIIPYIWLVNPKTKKVFIYQRAVGNGDYSDKRYINKISGGIGGHIDKDAEERSSDPIMAAMVRELKEELIMDKYPTPKFFGYMRDHSDMFNKVHLGFVGLAETELDAKPADGMAKGAFHSIEEVERIFEDPANQVEPWTRRSWGYVRKRLLN